MPQALPVSSDVTSVAPDYVRRPMGDHATVTVNDVELAYLEAGGSGPLALCLHGFPDSAHTWRHLLPRLADAGYRAVAPFMRGSLRRFRPIEAGDVARAMVSVARADIASRDPLGFAIYESDAVAELSAPAPRPDT